MSINSTAQTEIPPTVVFADATESFNHIMKLMESGVTFTHVDHNDEALTLIVEEGRHPGAPAAYSYPSLAASPDATVARLAAEAAAAAMRAHLDWTPSRSR